MLNKDPELQRLGLSSNTQKIKYDNFVTQYLLLGNGTEAYKILCPNVTHKSATEASHRYLKHPYIMTQIKKRNDDINKLMSEKIQINRERVIEELVLILDKTKGEGEHNLSLKSLDQIAKVIGAYAPIQTENEHKGVVINYIKPNVEEDTEEED